MIKKLFTKSTNTITSAAVIIGAAAFASRILGVLRDRILAGQFGAGEMLDIYYAAFRIPDLMYNLLVLGALSAGFIPVFIAYQKKSKQCEWQLAAGVLNILVLALLAVAALLCLAAPWIVPLVVPGFDAEAQAMTVTMTRIMFASPVLLGISAIWGGILQSSKRFFVYSLAPIMYNIGIMIGAIYFTQWWGMYGLAWGVVLGAGLHMLIQLPTVLQLGFRYQLLFPLRHPGVRQIIKLMVPQTLGLALSQVNLLVMNIIASMLAVGSIAVFHFANNLQHFPLGVFGLSFAIAAFPTLSAHAAQDDRADFIRSFSSTARQILFFIIPLSALFIVLRAQITRVVLGAGLFDWADTILTADTLALFCLSLFAQALIPLLARSFYALQNTVIPFLSGLVAAIANVLFALYFSANHFTIGTLDIHGVTGLAFAFSLSSILNMIILWVALRIKLHHLDEQRILWAVFKISVATVALGITTQLLKFWVEPLTGTTTFVGIFSQGLLAGIAGLTVFLLVSLLLRSEEMITFLKSIRRKFLRKEAVESLEEGIQN